MQRWEYLTIGLLWGKWSDSSGRKGTLPVLQGAPEYDPAGLMNELGDQGWELAGVSNSGSSTHLRLFLKWTYS